MGRSINRFNELRQTNARCMAHCTMWGGRRAPQLQRGERRWQTGRHRGARGLSLSLSLPLSMARTHARTSSRVPIRGRHCVIFPSKKVIDATFFRDRRVSEWWLTKYCGECEKWLSSAQVCALGPKLDLNAPLPLVKLPNNFHGTFPSGQYFF